MTIIRAGSSMTFPLTTAAKQALFPHSFYIDRSGGGQPDEIWPGSGIITSLMVESTGATATWTVSIHDCFDATTKQKLIYLQDDGGQTFVGVQADYGAHSAHSSQLAEFTDANKLWEKVIDADAYFPNLEIVCPAGMAVLFSATTGVIQNISIGFQPWVNGRLRHRNQSKPRNLNL